MKKLVSFMFRFERGLKPLPNEYYRNYHNINLTTKYQLLLKCNKVHRACSTSFIYESPWSLCDLMVCLWNVLQTALFLMNPGGGMSSSIPPGGEDLPIELAIDERPLGRGVTVAGFGSDIQVPVGSMRNVQWCVAGSMSTLASNPGRLPYSQLRHSKMVLLWIYLCC
jgi:hypothetical protein